MSDDKRGSEQEVGELHGQITKICNMTASNMIKRADLAIEKEDFDDVPLILDTRDVANLMKWTAHNRITCPTAVEDANSPLAKQIKELKDKAYETHSKTDSKKTREGLADVISLFDEEAQEAI